MNSNHQLTLVNFGCVHKLFNSTSHFVKSPSQSFTNVFFFFFLETEMVTLDLQLLPSPTHLCSPSPLERSSTLSSPGSPSATSVSDLSDWSSTSNTSFPSRIPKTWPGTFKVPWDRMQLEIRSAIANSKRPTPAERWQMVRVLVDEMRKCEANPTRSQFLTVCQNIMRQYPPEFCRCICRWLTYGWWLYFTPYSNENKY